VTASKLIARTRRLEMPFGIHIESIFYFISVKKFGTLAYVVGVSFPPKLPRT